MDHAKPMNMEEILRFCEGLPGITWDYPFGKEPRCYRVGGRIFAQAFPRGVEGALGILMQDASIPRERVCPMVTLSCQPFQGDFYRRQFPGTVLRPYHSPPAQQPYANTVLLDGAVPGDSLREMILHAYTHIRGRLPARVQNTLPPWAPEEYGGSQ